MIGGILGVTMHYLRFGPKQVHDPDGALEITYEHFPGRFLHTRR